MPDGVAILDDLDTALSRLTDFGRGIIEPHTRRVREAASVFAAVAGWEIISHGAFQRWARQHIVDRRALILDPLFDDYDRTVHVAFGRLNRTLTAEGWEIAGTLPKEMDEWASGIDIDVIDDVANSGMTLRRAAGLIQQRGRRPSTFICACSTSAAKAATLGHVPGAKWSQLLDGDIAAIHLRDGCPFVPLAGRAIVERSPIETSGGSVCVRTLATAFRGGLWEHLAASNLVRQAISTALWAVIKDLSRALGRDATVSDIPLLGSEVCLPLLPQQDAAADTPLRCLWV